MDDLDSLESGAGAYLFVYGTLRKGFRSHALLQRFHARLLGKGHVRGRLHDLGQYPGATEDGVDGDRIQGELYWLPRAEVAFRVLDRFEGFHRTKAASSEFVRRETTVAMASGGEMRAWMYWHPHLRTRACRIPSGSYALYRK